MVSSTHYRIVDRYFKWLTKEVEININGNRIPSYYELMRKLFDRKFYYTIDMDENRANDGEDLRYIYCDDYDAYDENDKLEILEQSCGDCSILEMMVALSDRISRECASYDEKHRYFWGMISSLGLDRYDDIKYNEDIVDEILDTFLDREYENNGKGSLFRPKMVINNYSELEIWNQLQAYLISEE